MMTDEMCQRLLPVSRNSIFALIYLFLFYVLYDEHDYIIFACFSIFSPIFSKIHRNSIADIDYVWTDVHRILYFKPKNLLFTTILESIDGK